MRTRSALVACALVLVIAAGGAFAQMSTPSQDHTGTVARIDAPAHVIVLDDGRMYRLQPETVVLVDDQPTALEQLRPGQVVVIRAAEAVAFQNGQYVVAAPAADTTTVTTVTTVTTARPHVTNAIGTVARVDAANSAVVLTDGRVVVVGPTSVIQANGRPSKLASLLPGEQVVITETNPVVSRDGRSAVLNQGYVDADTGAALTSDSKYAGYEADISHAGMQIQTGG